jgi:hypothetical protein
MNCISVSTCVERARVHERERHTHTHIRMHINVRTSKHIHIHIHIYIHIHVWLSRPVMYSSRTIFLKQCFNVKRDLVAVT